MDQKVEQPPTASEAVEADLIRPMSPAPIGRGHMPIPNLLGQTVSESIRSRQEYRHKGTSNIYVDFFRPSYVAEVFDPEDDEDEVEEELVLDPDELKNFKQLYGKIQFSLKDNHLMKLNLIIFSSQLN